MGQRPYGKIIVGQGQSIRIDHIKSIRIDHIKDRINHSKNGHQINMNMNKLKYY